MRTRGCVSICDFTGQKCKNKKLDEKKRKKYQTGDSLLFSFHSWPLSHLFLPSTSSPESLSLSLDPSMASLVESGWQVHKLHSPLNRQAPVFLLFTPSSLDHIVIHFGVLFHLSLTVICGYLVVLIHRFKCDLVWIEVMC